MNDATDTFHRLRPRLQGIAYRMLGSSAEAEEVVQDAWLRWHEANQEQLASREAWLVAVTTRLAIDRLRAAKVQREHYVGTWLPEPLLADAPFTPEQVLERADDVSVAFLSVLERLTPEARPLSCCAKCSMRTTARWPRRSARPRPPAGSSSIAPRRSCRTSGLATPCRTKLVCGSCAASPRRRRAASSARSRRCWPRTPNSSRPAGATCPASACRWWAASASRSSTSPPPCVTARPRTPGAPSSPASVAS